MPVDWVQVHGLEPNADSCCTRGYVQTTAGIANTVGGHGRKLVDGWCQINWSHGGICRAASVEGVGRDDGVSRASSGDGDCRGASGYETGNGKAEAAGGG